MKAVTGNIQESVKRQSQVTFKPQNICKRKLNSFGISDIQETDWLICFHNVKKGQSQVIIWKVLWFIGVSFRNLEKTVTSDFQLSYFWLDHPNEIVYFYFMAV